MATLLAQSETSAASGSETQKPAPLFVWIFPALGVLSLIASCVLWSLKRHLWGDEVFSWIELRDPSLPHLLPAVMRVGGGGMPLFYLTAWPWAHVFGFSDLSLRLYSCASVCGAFLLLASALRRRFSAPAAFLGTAFGLFASLIVVEQNSEARGYGLFLLLSAAAIAQLLRVAETPNPRRRDLLLLALSQAALVLGHVLGLIDAGLLLAALIASDAVEKRFRWRVYACAMAGWLALVPWIPAIRASAAVGRPHGWIPVPSFGDLASSFSFWLFTGLYWQLPHLPTAVLLAGWFCAVLIMIVLAASGCLALAGASGVKRPVYCAGFALIAAPLVFYAVSVTITPIFLPRYLIASALGVAILAAAWLDRSLARHARTGKGIAVPLLGVVVLALPIATALLAHPQQLDVARVDSLAGGRPIVCDSQKDFLVMTRYTAHPGTPQYVLDWPAALAGPPGTTADIRLMQNYRREGYLPGQLPDPAQLLGQPSFLVLTNQDASWFRIAVQNNPRFTWKTIAEVDASRRLVLVRQKQQQPGYLRPVQPSDKASEATGCGSGAVRMATRYHTSHATAGHRKSFDSRPTMKA
ncbi:MAG TPA: glycosyltransferase family 39 protein [Acidobacteriaceae bacterium]|jgi:hypothetical protein|nr:glycosyltransferase family 39 protein [Acidobacteriaceae bacterium]